MNFKIYLIRHGKVHNPKDILYERQPRFKLSEEGKKEIFKSAKFLKSKKINRIYSSPLLRTKQTAQIIQSLLKKPLSFSSDLLEVRTSYAGSPRSEMRKMNWNLFFPPQYRHGDEKIEEILKRMLRFINRVQRKYPHQSIVISGHGDPIMILKAYIEGLPLSVLDSIRDDYVVHGEVMEIEVGDKMKLKRVFVP